MKPGVTCEVCGKVGYRSETAARHAHSKAHFRVRIYRCPGTGLYHATNGEKA